MYLYILKEPWKHVSRGHGQGRVLKSKLREGSHVHKCFEPPFPLALQHRLVHPGRVAGPVLRGLLEPAQLRLSAPAAVLPSPPLPGLRPGAPRPQPAGPLPPPTAV